jgi:hypothetical protein
VKDVKDNQFDKAFRAEIPVTLLDQESKETRRAIVRVGPLGIEVAVEGYGDATTRNGFGAPIFIELQDKVLMVHLWADINQEDPTHSVCMEGALEDKRAPSFREEE